jgi:hypothetical protein
MRQRQFSYAPSLLEEVCALEPKNCLRPFSDHRRERLIDFLWRVK